MGRLLKHVCLKRWARVRYGWKFELTTWPNLGGARPFYSREWKICNQSDSSELWGFVAQSGIELVKCGKYLSRAENLEDQNPQNNTFDNFFERDSEKIRSRDWYHSITGPRIIQETFKSIEITAIFIKNGQQNMRKRDILLAEIWLVAPHV